jgi:hypothetical protein
MRININVEKAGTLPEIIPSSRWWQITDLTITGNLNGTDINLLRTIMGGHGHAEYYKWDSERKTPGPIEKLDISGAKIVSGGQPFKNTEYFDGRFKRSSIDEYFENKGSSVEFQGKRDGYEYGAKNITSNDIISKEMFLGCWRIPVLVLPNTITRIEDIAFMNCWHLSKLYIGSNVKSISGYIFYSCERLKEIHIRCTTPPTIGKNTFNYFGFDKSKVKLFVPRGSHSKYWLSWEYDNIEEE